MNQNTASDGLINLLVKWLQQLTLPGVLAVLGRVGLAVTSGILVYYSYEPHGQWVFGIVGMSMCFLVLAPWGNNRPHIGFTTFLGFIQAFALYGLLLPWIGEFVGNGPYIALAITEALYGLLLGCFGGLVARLPHGPWLFALVFMPVEWLRAHWPFGGFAWGRLAWGQVDGPLAWWMAIGGPVLVTFLTVLCGVALVYAFMNKKTQGLIIAAVPLILGMVIHYAPSAGDSGHIAVAAIQGNVPRMGLDFNAQRRAVLTNHVRETGQVQGPVDMVFWPENSSDVNPFTDVQAGALIDSAVKELGAPILVGTITADQVGDRNTMVVIDPITGSGDSHNKKYLQPFGEYMPMRDFFRNFSPLVDQAGDFKPGNGDGTVHMRAATTGSQVTVGVMTCYEVAFDQAGTSAIKAGAEILVTPTNNATFGFTDMTYQQLAMSRMRAIEYDRAVVVPATSGVSALIDPDGKVIQQSQIFQAAVLQGDMPLRTTRTPAVYLANSLEWVLVIMGAGSALIAAFAALRRNA